PHSTHPFLSLLLPPPPNSTLFPYTTLFRSGDHDAPPGRDVGSAVAELGERRHVGERRRALRGGGREDAQLSPFCLSHPPGRIERSEEHTSELQSRFDLVCRLLLEKKKKHSL